MRERRFSKSIDKLPDSWHSTRYAISKRYSCSSHDVKVQHCMWQMSAVAQVCSISHACDCMATQLLLPKKPGSRARQGWSATQALRLGFQCCYAYLGSDRCLSGASRARKTPMTRPKICLKSRDFRCRCRVQSLTLPPSCGYMHTHNALISFSSSHTSRALYLQ